MRRSYTIYAFVVLLIIAVLAIIDGLNNSNAAENLRKEKNELVEKVAKLKKDYENSANLLDDVKKDKKQLEENLSQIEEEVKAFRSSIEYKEFTAAINTIESYKATQSFEEANDFIALKDGVGSYTTEGNCPCGFFLSEKGFEWIPNVVLDIKEFRIEKDKVYLTYNTVGDVNNNYQFVLTKEVGRNEMVEKWRIEDIKLVAK